MARAWDHLCVDEETRLAGGNVGGAIRVGDTVRRPTGPWTPAVHALLRHLEGAGLDGIPQVLGIDESGREILSFLPGRSVDVDNEVVSDALLAAGVSWLRRFHNAVRTYRPSGPVEWRGGPRTLGDDEIICHHDPGAYNWIVSGDRLVGVIDWDMAGPGRPLDDLAFMAWNSVPLYRPIPVRDAAHRLALMADTYGDVDPLDLMEHSVVRMTKATDRIAAGQQAGDPGMLNLATVGEPAQTRRRITDFRGRRPEIAAALR